MIKNILKDGGAVLGTWCDIPSTSVINIIAKAGLDFGIIDMEHGPIDFNIALNMVMAAESDNCEALIRVPSNDDFNVLRALDTGCGGIIIPHIETALDMEKAIYNCKFKPYGDRSYNPFVRSGGYNKSGPEYFNSENESKLIGLIVEGERGIKNLKEIMDNKFVDVIYIGAYDLSVSVGVPGDIYNKKVLKLLEESIYMIKDKKKAVGYMAHSIEDIENYKNLGIQFIVYKVDASIIFDSYSNISKEFLK